jgi:hypothetical protein
VPETTIDENSNFLSCEDDIGFAYKVVMDTITTDTLGKKKFPEIHLRAGIFCPDSGHIVFPLILSENICHKTI